MFVFDLVIAFRIVGCGLVCLFDWLDLDLVADWGLIVVVLVLIMLYDYCRPLVSCCLYVSRY